VAITLIALALLVARKKRRDKMDADALLKKIENVVESPAAASAPVAVAPINWGVARRQLSRAQSYIRRGSAMNGVHEGVLLGAAPSKKAKRKAAARKAARTRAREEEKRVAAAKKAARTKAREEKKRQKAAAKGARTRAKNEEKKRLAVIKAKSTRTRNANKKAKAVAKGKRTKARKTTRRKHGRK